MKSNHAFSLVLGVGLALAVIGAGAYAQDLGALKGLAGGGDMSSLSAGSAGNAAGVIEFCVENNYLGGEAAASMKDKLMGKAGIGGDAKDDGGYADGAKGLVQTSDGKSIDLAGMGKLKSSVTKKACAAVLDHAKSLL